MDFSLVLQQNGATVASSTVDATFTVRGTVCTVEFNVTASAAGTAGTQITLVPGGLPRERQAGYRNYCRGWIRYTRIGVNTLVVPTLWESGTLTPYNLGISPSFAVASTDQFAGLLKFTVA